MVISNTTFQSPIRYLLKIWQQTQMKTLLAFGGCDDITADVQLEMKLVNNTAM